MNEPDSTPSTSAETEDEPLRSAVRRWLGRLFRLAVFVAIVVPSAYISYHWMLNPPVAQRRPPQPQARLVEVTPVQVGPNRIVVKAMGTVTPTRSVQIAAQVAGRIIEVHPDFNRGGRLAMGEKIIQIERDDYELAVRQQEGNVIKAEADFHLEMGQQAVALREYELLGEDVSEEEERLLLRQPQLASKEAAVAVAKAALDKARLDLERTAVRAPFDVLVLARTVTLGSHVTPGAAVATVANADSCWVEVTMPVADLQWIGVPGVNGDSGAPVRIFQEAAWGSGVFREGVVERLLFDLEPQGRMARLLVRVDDPMDLDAPENTRRPLLFGSFVRVEIEGREVPDVVRLLRQNLREGDKVWVMMPDNTLDIRPVQIVWGDNEYVLVGKGLANGELLVTSDLASPVQGMLLRTGAEPGEGTSEGRSGREANTP